MNRLIDAVEALFAAATQSRVEAAATARFTLGNVNWRGRLRQPEAVSCDVVATQLEAACGKSGQRGSSSRVVAEALLPVAEQLQWHRRFTDRDNESDMAAFSRNFASTCVIGKGGLLPSDTVIAGLSLQGHDTYYPTHSHRAEESYWIIGGGGEWKVDDRAWFAVEPGDCIYHRSGARHAMQTNEQPLLAVWLWTSHLNSEVVIVRG